MTFSTNVGSEPDPFWLILCLVLIRYADTSVTKENPKTSRVNSLQTSSLTRALISLLWCVLSNETYLRFTYNLIGGNKSLLCSINVADVWAAGDAASCRGEEGRCQVWCRHARFQPVKAPSKNFKFLYLTSIKRKLCIFFNLRTSTFCYIKLHLQAL